MIVVINHRTGLSKTIVTISYNNKEVADTLSFYNKVSGWEAFCV